MTDQNVNDTISFDLPKHQSSVIKVVGVGGGGSNAVNHMFNMGIRGVDFVICNTDSQALENSPIPNKIQLGVTLTEGLGAGANPEVGQQAALENIEEIKGLLNTNTKMVFITAGMGGGTGTGAAPVIARAAKECGILTVGIVTNPFLFEGNNRKIQAEKGIEELRKNVDSLVVINNNKLREVYGNLGFKAGFAKADEVLATAARGIAEVITHHYTTNIDLRDARTVLADSGTAIMGSSTASGDNRAALAIGKALDSPLLNDNHIRGAKNVLLLIVSGKEEITIDEIGEINDHIQNEAGGSANIIMGIGEDENLGDDVAVTIIATGFNADQQAQSIGREPQRVIHTLEDEQAVSASIYTKPLKIDESEDEDMINAELAKAKKREEEAEARKNQQPNLFGWDQELPETQKPEEPVNLTPEPAPQPEPQAPETPEEEIRMYELPEEEEEIPAPPTSQVEPVNQPEYNIEEPHREEPSAEAKTEEDENVFFTIGSDDDTPAAEWTPDEDTFEAPKAAEEPHRYEAPKQPTPRAEEKPAPQPPREEPKQEQAIRYSLDDYRELEQRLNAAAPQQKETLKKPQVEEDHSLNFEVKKVQQRPAENPPTPTNQGGASAMDAPINDHMRMRMEERKAQLKAFNYRFKNHPSAVDEAEDIPAYKRQGISIESENHSSNNSVSRFTVDNDENGTDIRPNNRFLHDNVD